MMGPITTDCQLHTVKSLRHQSRKPELFESARMRRILSDRSVLSTGLHFLLCPQNRPIRKQTPHRHHRRIDLRSFHCCLRSCQIQQYRLHNSAIHYWRHVPSNWCLNRTQLATAFTGMKRGLAQASQNRRDTSAYQSPSPTRSFRRTKPNERTKICCSTLTISDDSHVSWHENWELPSSRLRLWWPDCMYLERQQWWLREDSQGSWRFYHCSMA